MGCSHPTPSCALRLSLTREKGKSKLPDTSDDVPHFSACVRISWARLLKRVFDIDMDHSPHCGGKLKIIAAILKHSAIAKILNHLGLPTRAPPRSPAPTDSFEPI
jgi:hypothetical protein